MNESGHRENGRKPDVYKAAQSQWLMHQPSMKQIMSIMAERDAAIQERNMALNGKNKAMEERELAIMQRDAAIMQRDAAIREKNEAIMERDSALVAPDYRQSAINSNNTSCPPGCQVAHGVKHIHHPQQHLLHQPLTGDEACYDPKQVTVTEAALVTVGPENPKAWKVKQPKEPKPVSPNKKPSKPSKKAKTEGDSSNKMVFAKPHLELKGTQEISGSDENKQLDSSPKPDWKDQDLGLNQVIFDEANMPTPVCSCTGVYRHCYKWGNGGWQSACCTTTMSMYPLPPVPNKRHARVGGRKMSGSAFSKLLKAMIYQWLLISRNTGPSMGRTDTSQSGRLLRIRTDNE